MSSLVFKELIIFSPIEELAKIVELKPGLNVITSLRKDGNDLGKSIIAKSFYHCLGADCLFDTKFDASNKVFIVILECEGVEYTIYRSGSLFKMFGPERQLLWTTSHRHELGALLYEQFGFAIWLPSRSENKIEITPPAYSYTPYFIDQNHYNGSSFKSFDNLGQYPAFKESLIYTLTGAYDEEYFTIKAEKEPLASQQNDTAALINLNRAMAEHVSNELSELGYSADMDTLEKDCARYETDYKQIAAQLNGIRNQLYALREERSQLDWALTGAKALGKRLNKYVDNFDGEKCPLCNNDIQDSISIRISACVTHTDALLLGDELEKELHDVERDIIRKEKAYQQYLDKLEALKRGMSDTRKASLTATQIDGLTMLSKKLTDELGQLENKYKQLEEALKIILAKLEDYSEVKADIDRRYIDVIARYVDELNLQSIDINKIKNIGNRFEADGSNAPLATVAWYFTLLKLKDEFNPTRINLPLILDSPMNVEADDEKYDAQYGLVFTTFKYQHQMLVTGLGLANSSVVPKEANVIVLDNKKYHLLNSKDFKETKDLVFEYMEQH